jgi:hypothetical protein
MRQSVRLKSHKKLFARPTIQGEAGAPVVPLLPRTDNEPGAPEALMAANLWWRNHHWPAPFETTTHVLQQGDARDLSDIPDSSVHLVVTSPPYFNLKPYESDAGGRQLGRIDDYEAFLAQLDLVWKECYRGAGSVALWATCWYPEKPVAVISSCRCPRIFRCGRAVLASTI